MAEEGRCAGLAPEPLPLWGSGRLACGVSELSAEQECPQPYCIFILIKINRNF